ncbi:MAG: IspD/TarI family cytidylyltransferase [Desulfobacterales bacterium]|jgi:2-C-methyl-D-erythritol 4-phosphate cytidylyltransferase
MISALITAAGYSSRYERNKMLEPIKGRPLIVRTLERFLACEEIDEIVVTARKEDIGSFTQLTQELDIVSVVLGGEQRVESMLNAINASSGDILITHDGARPLVRPKLIKKLIHCVKETGAAMTAINPTATVKISSNQTMKISGTLPRIQTWIAQTPQGYTRELIKQAMEKAVKEKYFVPTDDSEIVANITSHDIMIVPGDYSNIKVTHQSDIEIANALFEECS